MKADADFIVLDRKDLDAFVDQARGHQREAGASGLVDIQFECHKHTGAGVTAKYFDGLIIVRCHECDSLVGQIQVAEESDMRKLGN